MTATIPAAAAVQFDYDSVTCTMPGCDEDLHLVWTMSVPVFEGDLGDGADLPVPGGAYTSTWRIECVEGHVVLLPGDPGCPTCGDDNADCRHDDYDGSDETRTFRRHDVQRLQNLLTWSKAGAR